MPVTCKRNALNARQDAGDAAFRLQVTGTLMKINGSRLVLQNNRKTGEQALAALLPTLTTEDLRGQRSEAWRAPWRANDRPTTDAATDESDLSQPFRLDDDSDLDDEPFSDPDATYPVRPDIFPPLPPES